ncbi:AER283Wp [Eremothecium gossypii ATCC 10895]|uniref:inorganic diphosphatase n=1 Tax=Eremothecium gossypii (strain ATCC 10895 / CBS 109.51 / FGSC 9923 / NRRL Y-1056) TaxID=284811 RepID=Q756H8_EREGS|nr:AER283Wp [Eremothecium gossypii ATCC 10895]AAS52964.1 AER283Wp [Eremothecium gossypii ATCC 10895]AEY97272.1 FAER283Wp [Eremothecium gossypii FDAG1]
MSRVVAARLQSARKAMNRLFETNTKLQNYSHRYSTVVRGAKYSQDYAQYLVLPNGETGSYFHDIPLGLDLEHREVNMVVEVPRWSNGKFEISRTEDFNPIKQDVKNGKPRFVNNIYPFKGYIHNYGAIPQTWENPAAEGLPGLNGDNDPLDCCEIGSAVFGTGEVRRVKVLGSLALIDDGELDWKVIVIDCEDPKSAELNTLDDVRRVFPRLLDDTITWFRNYKIPTGKPANKFAFDSEYQPVEKTLGVIQECHSSWKDLIDGKVQYHKLPNTTRAGKNVRMEEYKLPDAQIPPAVDIWYHV